MWSLALLLWSWALLMWCLSFQKLEIQTHKLSGSGIMICTATASVISILHTTSFYILIYLVPFWNVCQYPWDIWGNGAADKHVQQWVSLQWNWGDINIFRALAHAPHNISNCIISGVRRTRWAPDNIYVCIDYVKPEVLSLIVICYTHAITSHQFLRAMSRAKYTRQGVKTCRHTKTICYQMYFIIQEIEKYTSIHTCMV